MLALLRFPRAARSAELRSCREDALAAVSWLTTMERRAEHNLLLGLPGAMHGVLDTRNCKTASALKYAVANMRFDGIPSQQEEVIQGQDLSVNVNVNVYRSPPIASESPWPRPRRSTSG